jgi:hypothetical protein
LFWKVKILNPKLDSKFHHAKENWNGMGLLFIIQNDEPYQSNKNQSTPKQGEYKEQKWKDPHPKRQKIHLRR